MTDPLATLNNIGFHNAARAFPGFAPLAGAVDLIVEPRQAHRLALMAGDVLRIDPADTTTLHLIARHVDGCDASAALGLEANSTTDCSDIDNPALSRWLSELRLATNKPLSSARIQRNAVACDSGPAMQSALILRVTADCVLILANPVPSGQLVSGHSAGAVTVRRLREAAQPSVPEPLANLVDEIFVPRATALAYELRRGQKVQIIDLEGQQCSDFQALTRRALDRGVEKMIDGTATRSMVRRAYPQPGLLDKFFDVEMTPMLRVVRDTCGRHDTFGLACTARGYEERGFPGHVNCSDNISNALQPYGVAPRRAWPAINLFWNTWLDQHHQIQTEESWSRPGDYVVMEALQDLVCVSTACPDDIDPINGWNPTDILVRIYSEKETISRAVAYREKENQPMLVSEQSAFHERLAPLTNHFAPARDLWAPVSFPSVGTIGEYWACRENVTVQDMSGLRKYDIIGPDATRLLQLATTRNVARLAVWRGQYTLMCDQTGSLIDDGTLFRLAPDLYRWCCGNEQSGRALQALATEHNLQVRINPMRNALPNLAVQGPRSRELLSRICFTQPHVPSLAQMKWFGVSVARVHDRDGTPFMISRSGYTGELGYELFCAKGDAVALWDAVMAAGEEIGVTAMGSAALEIIRIEAGLAAANAEFAPGINAFEAGLGFAVDMDKPEFTGRAALLRARDNPARVLKGLKLAGDDVPAHGCAVFDGERQIGVVTSATRSPMLETSIAMARLAVEYSQDGCQLEVGQLDGRMKRLAATVCPSPFVDPQRKRARA